MQPDGFVISDDATEKHGVSHGVAASQGEPLVKCLRELLDDIALLKLQGGRLCSHNLEFDAGILMEEMNRSELADLAEPFAEAVRGVPLSLGPNRRFRWSSQSAPRAALSAHPLSSAS